MKIGDTLYFDHQATTPLDPSVLDAMQPFFTASFGNPHATDHIVGWKASQAVEQAATEVSTLVGCDPDEIVFTSGATEANNLALLGLGRRAINGQRKRILLGATEHKCVLATGRILRDQLGYEVVLIPVDSKGRIDLEFLEAQLEEDVLIVSIMAVNNEIGTVQNVAEIGRLSHRVGAYFHCDGAQAACALDLSTISQDVDLLSLSAHKMYGPMGIGALYVQRDAQPFLEPIIYGGGQQNGLRSGTVPMPLCVGFGAAATFATADSAARDRASLSQRRNRFVEKLRELSCEIWINGPALSSERHPGNANIGFLGVDAHDLLSTIQPRLAASTGSACTSGTPEVSHVLRAIGLTEEQAASSIRFSLGKDTTDHDVDEAVEIIGSALAKLEQNGLLRAV